MTDVYHINQVRMIRDLEEFDKKKVLSNFIVQYLKDNGIEKTKFYEFCSGLSKKQTRILHKRLVNAYYHYNKDNNEIDLQIRYDLEDAYFTITNNLMTKDVQYFFPSVLNKYRRDINPVRALYFDVLELEVDFNHPDGNQEFIISKFKDTVFFRKLMHDIETDINSLEMIENKFEDAKKSYPFFTFPLSFYHTQEMIKDMKKWIKTFNDFYRKINGEDLIYD